tara:strand:+ start:1110 stop:1790 length:681 start_codon:yes stop_codon:yes gene_type:complete
MREIILDTETTGLNYKEGDRIIEVGCIELLNHMPTGSHLHFYCSTKKEIKDEAKSVHGLTNEFLKKFPTFTEQANKLLHFIKQDVLVIHNAAFDIGFINNELKLAGLTELKNNVIDTVSLARKTLNTRIANLDYLCKRFSIDLSQRKLHGALKDCNLLSEVYIELLGGKQTKLDLNKENPIQKNLKRKKQQNDTKINTISISNEEVQSHKKFINNLKNSLWSKLDY